MELAALTDIPVWLEGIVDDAKIGIKLSGATKTLAITKKTQDTIMIIYKG